MTALIHPKSSSSKQASNPPSHSTDSNFFCLALVAAAHAQPQKSTRSRAQLLAAG